MDWDNEGLLEGLEDDAARDARRRLLDELHAQGMDVEELRRVVAEDKLVLAPVARALSSEARYTAREIAERAGRRARVPDREPARARAPGAGRRRARLRREGPRGDAARAPPHRQVGFDDEDALEVARVLGQGMARYAEATRALVARTFIEPGLDEYELAHRYRAVAEQLMPLAGPWLEHVFALHLQQVLRSDALTQEQRRAGKLDDTQEAVIAFADLVGFTELGESVPVEELGSVAGRLSRLAGDACEPPVRLVKLIGDAVMLVSPEPEPMLDVTLRLVEHGGRGRGLPAAARGHRLRPGRAPLGRLVRHAGQPRQPAHHPRAALDRARLRGDPRRGRRRLRVLRRRPQEAQGLLVTGARLPALRRAGDAAPAAPAR